MAPLFYLVMTNFVTAAAESTVGYPFTWKCRVVGVSAAPGPAVPRPLPGARLEKLSQTAFVPSHAFLEYRHTCYDDLELRFFENKNKVEQDGLE